MNELDNHFKIKRNKHVSKDSVILTKEFKRAMWINRIWKAILVLILFAIGFVCMYISFVGPIKTPDGYIRTNHDDVKIGDTVIATSEKDTLSTRFKESAIGPETIVYGEIIAGPYGVLYGKDGQYTIEDEDKTSKSNIALNGEHEKFLNEEYIIRCTSGNCNKGEDYLFSKGKVKGTFKSNTLFDKK